MNNVIIQASNLVRTFGDFRAVDSIDLSIPAGICYGFLGPNGAGKTTTMRMIYCASPVSEGKLTVNGLDVMADLSAVKHTIGVVTQEDSLDYDLNVFKNLLVAARYYDIPRQTARERAEELIAFFQLSEKKLANVRHLSGGMKRRLQIARALINHPKVLILDEPTTGLDPQARHHVWAKLHELKEQGVTLLLTTHYMDEAEQLCDRLAIMDHGRIIAEDSPWVLIEREIPQQVIELRASADVREQILRSIGDRIELSESLSDRLLLYSDDGDRLLQAIKDLHLEVKTLLTRRATLEDVFLKLTGRELID